MSRAVHIYKIIYRNKHRSDQSSTFVRSVTSKRVLLKLSSLLLHSKHENEIENENNKIAIKFDDSTNFVWFLKLFEYANIPTQNVWCVVRATVPTM